METAEVTAFPRRGQLLLDSSELQESPDTPIDCPCRVQAHGSEARRLEVALGVVDVQLGVRAVHVACTAITDTSSPCARASRS